MNKIQTINLIKGSLCSDCKFNVACNHANKEFNICTREKEVYEQKRMTCEFWEKANGSKITGSLEIHGRERMMVAMDSEFLSENIEREMVYNFCLFDDDGNKREYHVKIKPTIQR